MNHQYAYAEEVDIKDWYKWNCFSSMHQILGR